MKKEMRIITVCGSGTISSKFLADRLKEELNAEGYDCVTRECTNGEIPNLLAIEHWDCICHASPVSKDDFPSVPCINSVGILTGIGDDDVIEKVLKIARSK